MARRKRVLDDGDDSDSSNSSDGNDHRGVDSDPDTAAERALFEDPYRRKRRKRGGQEDAIYGVFGESDEEEDKPRKKYQPKKQPAFVSATKEKLDAEDVTMEDAEEDSDGSEGEGADVDDQDMSDDSEPSRRPSPRIQSTPDDTAEDSSFNRGGLGMGRGGLGSGARGGFGSQGRGGLGSQSGFGSRGLGFTSAANSTSWEASPDVPSSFGANKSTSFQRAAPKPERVLDPSEQAHFQKLSGSFGARMLQKMGWQAGAGLGSSGEGIVTPVETKMRPGRSGIAFRGFKERTDQSKREAKRRGEDVSDEEEEARSKVRSKGKGKAQEKRSDAWKKPSKIKTKVEHKTYNQILEDAGETSTSGIGQIIDATGAVPREVGSLAEVSIAGSYGASNDPERIPEIRHNVRLIRDSCKTQVAELASEARLVDMKKKQAIRDDARLRQKVEEEARLIARLQQIQLVTNELQATAKNLSSSYEPALESFDPLIERLLRDFGREFAVYHLDQIIVGAIAPVARRLLQQWNPLQNPGYLVDILGKWTGALPVSQAPKEETQVDAFGAPTYKSPADSQCPMSPFDSLLWNVWLPKVRSAINNEWSAHEPDAVVRLYEAWSAFLPRFIADNVMDQLVLPKVRKAVADWSPKLDKASLQSIVFPWLPHLGLRMDELTSEARRKVKSVLRRWNAGEPVPDDLAPWRDVFGGPEWDNLLLKSIVPKLGATLRDDFTVNPRNQDMQPIEAVLAWAPLLHTSITAQLLETEFFPKWLDTLHFWLVQPRVSFEEVAQWYTFWKGAVAVKGAERGFTRGLQLMNDAIELGANAPAKLAKPDFRAEIGAKETAAKAPVVQKKTLNAVRTQEVTFKSIVEEYAAKHNLLVIPAGRAHEKSRMPMFRVSASVDGKGGILVYILDDAVWAAPEGVGSPSEEFVAIPLEAMVLRANGA
ncbi:TFP11-domain-containing protein [Cylindrobasidium torrendii FP15055 ss-10]|uniref:TFP11-domain-containing protein n=1 Tax=Cylindrobasidium torrendii FP15055 ss-10 TaxID=1314674 RepID=A0A0D7BMW2_9AGAR|nr:TFP11-domain-containing protein [Cylindrobasidium torrendii FP15055 ss-10]